MVCWKPLLPLQLFFISRYSNCNHFGNKEKLKEMIQGEKVLIGGNYLTTNREKMYEIWYFNYEFWHLQ